MTVGLIRALVRILGWLPLSVNRAVGRCIGLITWYARLSPRRITEINLALCFPDKSPAERQQLARSSLVHSGMTLSECAWLWTRPNDTVRRKIVSTSGLELFQQALAADRGLIVASPHIGNWELCNLPLSDATALRYFYRSPRKPLLEPLLVSWRAKLGGSPASLNTQGIREALRLLKNGGTLGILPDQEPDLSGGLFVPFYSVPALTMTLLGRLARKSNAQVLFCISWRLPGGAGWHLQFTHVDPQIADPDALLATTALSHSIEQCIADAPEQYLWGYKRFAMQADGTARNYRQAPAPEHLA